MAKAPVAFGIFASKRIAHNGLSVAIAKSRRLSEASYEFRGSLRTQTQTYAATDDALSWPGGRLAFEDIASLRLYRVPGMRSLGYGTVVRASRRCTIRARDGKKIVLTDQHFLGFGRFEDRSAAYVPFVRALIASVAACSPGTRLFVGMPPALWWYWFLMFGTLALGLAVIIVFGTIGLVAEGQFTWAPGGFVLLMAAIGIGPAQYLRGLWRHRPHPFDPASYEV
jgi:hypothetical protein